MVLFFGNIFVLKTLFKKFIILLRYGDNMKNKKGFTLVELLAVIVILGVIMTIAIPNVVSTLEKNKKETFLEDAKKMISSAEYKIRSDTKIEYPNDYSITILTLKTINSSEIEESPYDTIYSEEKSFVAIVKNKDAGEEDAEYLYYVHLVSCTDAKCENTAVDSVESNRGINLTLLEDLNSSSRFDLVVKGRDVNRDLINDQVTIREMLNKDNINVY